MEVAALLMARAGTIDYWRIGWCFEWVSEVRREYLMELMDEVELLESALLLLAVWCPRWLCFCEFALRGHRIGLELRLPALGGLELSHMLWTGIGSEIDARAQHSLQYSTVPNTAG